MGNTRRRSQSCRRHRPKSAALQHRRGAERGWRIPPQNALNKNSAMTNDEIRMTKESLNPNGRKKGASTRRSVLCFVLRSFFSSFVLRHSSLAGAARKIYGDAD